MMFYSSLGIRMQKVRNQDIPGVTGKFVLGKQNEAGKRITEFCQENPLVIAVSFFDNTREDFTHEHDQSIPKSN